MCCDDDGVEPVGEISCWPLDADGERCLLVECCELIVLRLNSAIYKPLPSV